MKKSMSFFQAWTYIDRQINKKTLQSHLAATAAMVHCAYVSEQEKRTAGSNHGRIMPHLQPRNSFSNCKQCRAVCNCGSTKALRLHHVGNEGSTRTCFQPCNAHPCKPQTTCNSSGPHLKDKMYVRSRKRHRCQEVAKVHGRNPLLNSGPDLWVTSLYSRTSISFRQTILYTTQMTIS